MSADLLDDRVIEVAGVAQEAASDVVGVFQAMEDIIGREWELRTLPEFGSDVLALEVDGVDPALVAIDSGLGDVLLEDDDVGVRDSLSVGGREERSNAFVDGIRAEGWSC